MAVTRTDVIDLLATCPSEELRAILQVAEVRFDDTASPRELAERIVTTLWWSYSTPLGYVANRSEFSDIVRHASKRFGVHLTPTDRDPWSQLDAMMGHFTDQVGPMSFDDLEAAVQQRATRSVFPTAALFTGAGTSAGTGVAAKAILSLTQTPIGRLLPFVPKIGPWFTLVARSAGVASVVSGPLAIGLGVLAINQAMGTNYRKLLPLLIGIGALQAHRRVIDAEVVPSASPTT